MFRSPKSNFFLLLFNASLFVGCLAASSEAGFGQSAQIRPAAFSAMTETPELHHASPATAAAATTNLELRAFELINQERAKKGLRPLVWDAALTRMARTYSEKMARENFFSHKAPDGQDLRARSRASGLAGYKRLGENLGYNKGFEDAVSCAVAGWMRSEGHREHILDGEFTRSGLGIARSTDGSVYFTQVFVVR